MNLLVKQSSLCRIICGILLCIFVEVSDPLYASAIMIIDSTKTLQSQFSHENTIYVINSVCDLKGQSLKLPRGTVLRFNGGKFSNGKILKSSFFVDAPRICIFDNIDFVTLHEKELLQVDPVRVRILNSNTYFNIESDAVAKKGDIVNKQSLYRISSSSKTSSTNDGLRKVVIEDKEYVVSDKYGNYTYPTRNIVGIDSKTGEMLKSAIVDSKREVFYKLSPIECRDKSCILNREVYPEWFGCRANSNIDQSIAINYGIDVASNSRSILVFASGEYKISSPLVAVTNTKIVGVDSSPWNSCTVFSVDTKTGIIAYDEKGCNNILLEGLCFKSNNLDWVENYCGIEIRTSLQGMRMSHISCFQPKVGIHLKAYSDLLSASVENYKQLSGVYGIVMEPLFKTTFKSSYCNGNSVEIGTGGSALMKKNVVYVKNCKGNAVSYKAGEQYGNPSVYCDNSTITLSGITWHEESVFLQAVNRSKVTIIGEIYAMGNFLVDQTSTINYPNIMDSKYHHNCINPNYHIIDLAMIEAYKLDAKHASYLNRNGSVIIECVPQNIRYINGNPYYMSKSQSEFCIPYDKAIGVTVLMRVASSGEPQTEPVIYVGDSLYFQLSASSLFPINCIVSNMNKTCIGYLMQGESVFSFHIQNDKVYIGSKIAGEFKTYKDNVSLRVYSSSESFMISDILCVSGTVSDETKLHEYENFLINDVHIEIPKSGSIRPKLTESYKGCSFFDEELGRLIIWSGRRWLNVDGTIIDTNE